MTDNSIYAIFFICCACFMMCLITSLTCYNAAQLAVNNIQQKMEIKK